MTRIPFRLAAEKMAARVTRAVAIRWGESFPFYHVIEHPKSGGTWLADMVADYLRIPFPRHSVFPLGCSCVTQSFGAFHPALRRVFYIYRDGRDVMTSLYYDRVRIARHSDRPGRARVARTYERLLGKNYDPDDIARHLPRFIEFEFAHPGRGTRMNWRDHVDHWYRPERSGQIAYLSYEQLLEDCAGTLSRAIATVTGEPVDPWQLETTVAKMSMQRQTGREAGEVDISEHIRRGIAGEWREVFTREAAEIFNDLAGAALVRLGYEQDTKWVDRYPYP